jgi:hypothetical protein
MRNRFPYFIYFHIGILLSGGYGIWHILETVHDIFTPLIVILIGVSSEMYLCGVLAGRAWERSLTRPEAQEY